MKIVEFSGGNKQIRSTSEGHPSFPGTNSPSSVEVGDCNLFEFSEIRKSLFSSPARNPTNGGISGPDESTTSNSQRKVVGVQEAQPSSPKIDGRNPINGGGSSGRTWTNPNRPHGGSSGQTSNNDGQFNGAQKSVSPNGSPINGGVSSSAGPTYKDQTPGDQSSSSSSAGHTGKRNRKSLKSPGAQPSFKNPDMRLDVVNADQKSFGFFLDSIVEYVCRRDKWGDKILKHGTMLLEDQPPDNSCDKVKSAGVFPVYLICKDVCDYPVDAGPVPNLILLYLVRSSLYDIAYEIGHTDPKTDELVKTGRRRYAINHLKVPKNRVSSRSRYFLSGFEYIKAYKSPSDKKYPSKDGSNGFVSLGIEGSYDTLQNAAKLTNFTVQIGKQALLTSLQTLIHIFDPVGDKDVSKSLLTLTVNIPEELRFKTLRSFSSSCFDEGCQVTDSEKYLFQFWSSFSTAIIEHAAGVGPGGSKDKHLKVRSFKKAGCGSTSRASKDNKNVASPSEKGKGLLAYEVGKGGQITVDLQTALRHVALCVVAAKCQHLV